MRADRLGLLQDVLKAAKSGATARELARRLRWSTPSVYRGLERLREKGAGITEVREESRDATGPVPRQFILTREAEL